MISDFISFSIGLGLDHFILSWAYLDTTICLAHGRFWEGLSGIHNVSLYVFLFAAIHIDCTDYSTGFAIATNYTKHNG
jgi:hypothetical protein